MLDTFRQKYNLDRFDVTALIAMVILLIAITGIVLLGNNIGVQIESYTPTGITQSPRDIRIRFYEEMEQTSVEQGFSISPAVEGRFRWQGNRQVIFEPTIEFASGQTYTVSLSEGIQAASGGLTLKNDFQFSFRVNLPHVLYLAPANARDRNIYAYDLNTGETEQLTFTIYGVYDYAVSPDGQYIAYSYYNEDGTANIWLLDPKSGAERQLTNCVNSLCVAPAWNADGTEIAYEREEYNAGAGGVSARRIWVVNLETVESRLLFEDTQIVGYSPQYSPDGSKVGMYETSLPGIRIYNYDQDNFFLIESLQGVLGTFSPDGSRLVFPVLVRGAVGQNFYTHLEMIDMQDNTRQRLSGDEEIPLEDTLAIWHPDGERLVVARKYFDSRFTPGTQIYMMDTTTGAVEPLVVDPDYNHAGLSFSPDGRWLVMQRFNLVEPGARPEIWAYSLDSGDLTFITDEAFLPGVLP